ncbi:3-oxoacyl-[acyl-carrier-protein] synthase III C-terminal domain-containing protein [Legionella gresilensis]|uniref:3-oxoacyl-[acyl-carrier-protein] synthase III C-terminal domain-containing protein n=1 Tax=Legionella gresilensis TaxID=91823 RepID=UPI001F5E50DC|nr:3-oxoacyl-[acyl-carrier-protein] synthase III C-terminal domain-containing protein [Legionella gresilensis]
MNEGGTKMPSYDGFPHYVLSKKVPIRGAAYSRLLTDSMVSNKDTNYAYNDIDGFLIHTGSKKIIDGIIKNLEIEKHSDKANISYEVLSNFANLSSCSIGFMLNQVINNRMTGTFLLISFGVGFSGSIATITI